MFGRETRMLLRHYLEQGTSKSALARKFGVHRDTIHRWIRAGDLDRDLDGEPVRYGPRRPVPTKLDAFKPIIEARLAAYPQLSAVRLLEEIRTAGYSGRYTQLKPSSSASGRLPPPSRSSASRCLPAGRLKWISPGSNSRGVSGMQFWVRGRKRRAAAADCGLVWLGRLGNHE
jgi:transposase-like protein